MPPDQLRARRLVVCGAIAAVTIAYWRAVPPGIGKTDQVAYAEILGRMRHGANYYAATRDTFANMGIHISQARSIRLPTPFLVWQLLPASALYGLFLVVVVLATSMLLAWLTDVPIIALPIALSLLFAGRTVDRSGSIPVEQYLLPEIWVVPFVAAALLAWRRQRWWLAAGMVLATFLVRELMVMLLLGGLLAAHVEKRPRRPWIVAIAVAAAAYATHVVIASHYTYAVGNEAPLLGTARIPWSMLAMMDNDVPGPLVFGGLIWALALWACWRRREFWLLAPYLCLPLTGLIVDRPYWGMLFVSFTLFFAGEMVLKDASRLWVERRARRYRAGTDALTEAVPSSGVP